ncbi:MAG: hypothetical protein AAFZ15_02145 [Bacteroidota bacterium]
MNPINNNWVFGHDAGLDFTTTPPTPTSGFQMDTNEGCASISDQNGQLLFYTDGSSIWDTRGNPPITGLMGNTDSTQSAIIVPRPGSTTQFYIFTVDGRGDGSDSHVDGVLLDYPSWTTTPAVTPLPAGYEPTDKLTVVQHANCVDFWVLTVVTRLEAAYFRIWKLEAAGLTYIGDTNITPLPRPVLPQSKGYLRGSPDGSRLAFANWELSDVWHFPFDNANGVVAVSAAQVITAPPDPNNIDHRRRTYGVEFSPNNQLLYFSVVGDRPGQSVPVNRGYIYQHDLQNNSTLLIGTHEDSDPDPAKRDGYALGALQLGPDGIIYVAKDGENSLGAIVNPNAIGPASNLDLNYITLLGNSFCYMGLPNLLNSPCVENCQEICDKVDETLAERCKQKVNYVDYCEERRRCTCLEGKCETVEITPIRPCITMKWGDSECDCFETNDFEVFCLTVCNCYDNVTFKDFKIGMLEVVDENGNPVPTLPDGSPSVALHPVGPYCFGDIGPCGSEKNCVSREFVLVTKGALPGKYRILVKGVCFDVCFHYDTSECFEIELCKD